MNVALVGLHVVGRTDGHPEFVWATFEHKANAPMVADRQFKFDNTVDSNDYTFYKANTPFSQVNLPNTAPSPATKQTPVLSFNEKTQKFSPVSNAVQENKTGGESNSDGPANIASVNQSSHTWLRGQPKQAIFANYNLIGTVWKQANSYSPSNANWPNIDQNNSIGSVLLANTTAETYRQTPNHQTAGGAVNNNLHNCFSCHNPQLLFLYRTISAKTHRCQPRVGCKIPHL
ncbi:MAG: hypothetical protein NVV73_20090 [Cellvibrionaceae bacterium]|nr:hypothetical protein [Cellvibrionaceae bacterium]